MYKKKKKSKIKLKINQYQNKKSSSQNFGLMIMQLNDYCSSEYHKQNLPVNVFKKTHY